MKVHSPTDIQADVCRAIREQAGVSRFVTDDDIYSTVADLLADPYWRETDIFLKRPLKTADLVLATRVKLVLKVAQSGKFDAVVEASK